MSDDELEKVKLVLTQDHDEIVFLQGQLEASKSQRSKALTGTKGISRPTVFDSTDPKRFPLRMELQTEELHQRRL